MTELIVHGVTNIEAVTHHHHAGTESAFSVRKIIIATSSGEEVELSLFLAPSEELE